MHQPVMSSTAAQAMASVPRRLPSALRSVSILARTGKAVILMAAPMNSAKLLNATLSFDSRGYKYRARNDAATKGAVMLTWLVSIAAWPWLFNSLGLMLRPTRNMKMMTPTWLNALRYPRLDAGNR